jgi:hypothetical protein
MARWNRILIQQPQTGSKHAVAKQVLDAKDDTAEER